MSSENDIPIPQKTPCVIDEEPGKKAWCTCGRSGNQPYCDGAHAGTGMAPLVVEIEEAKTVAWCGCKRTCNPPYCDGSHSQLP
ncbi:MAG: CDGSH iron-sulfur domain-containing protein [Planctomycetota bacterium]|nr:CDGSH iron-sulfur domain-containing protein [Planctomycetota bacterium]